MVHHPLLVGACVCRLIRGVSNKWLEAAGPSPLHPKPVHIWSNEKLLPPRPSTALFNTWLGIQPQAPPPPPSPARRWQVPGSTPSIRLTYIGS